MIDCLTIEAVLRSMGGNIAFAIRQPDECIPRTRFQVWYQRNDCTAVGIGDTIAEAYADLLAQTERKLAA